MTTEWLSELFGRPVMEASIRKQLTLGRGTRPIPNVTRDAPPVLQHFLSDHLALVREATGVVSDLSAVHTSHASIISSGGFEALKEGCCRTEDMTSRFIALVLMNLSSLQDIYRELINWFCYNEFIELASLSQRE